MKKNHTKLIIFLGILCTLLTAASSWYSITFNDSRLVKPTNLSEYDFRIQDLPMIISGVLLALYILYLFALLISAIIQNKRLEATALFTRRINPKLGFLGLLGFLGFSGFWTYSVDKDLSPFLHFVFFGFFGFFFEGKMSGTLMDERYRENKMKAHCTADKTALAIIFIATLLLGYGRYNAYASAAFVVTVNLSLALDIFLGEYILYRYDHEELLEESED